MNYLLVGLGGALGSVTRYWIQSQTSCLSQYPFLTTWIINILGSCIIGFVLGKQEGQNPMAIFLATGFCGGFTTFSAFAWENLQLIKHHQLPMAIIYMLGSVLACLISVTIGYSISKI